MSPFLFCFLSSVCLAHAGQVFGRAHCPWLQRGSRRSERGTPSDPLGVPPGALELLESCLGHRQAVPSSPAARIPAPRRDTCAPALRAGADDTGMVHCGYSLSGVPNYAVDLIQGSRG